MRGSRDCEEGLARVWVNVGHVMESVHDQLMSYGAASRCSSPPLQERGGHLKLHEGPRNTYIDEVGATRSMQLIEWTR